MCFSSSGQTRRRLTEKHTLQPAPHGKAHSAQASHQKAHSGLIDSRKAALCDSQIAQTAPFCHIAAPGKCGATLRQAAGHYGKWPNWANALEHPPASLRGGCAGTRRPRPGAWLHGRAQSGQRASLMAHPGQVGTPSSCQLWAKEVPGTQDQPDQSRNRPVRKETPAKGRLRVRVRSRSHPGRGVLTSAQRLRVRSPSRPALPLAPERAAQYVHHRVAV